jgi:predicted dehydrogenase
VNFQDNLYPVLSDAMKASPMSVGVVGCGAVCGQYLQNGVRFGNLRFAACADLNPDAAKATARHFNIPRAWSVPELLADPQVELVLNLTIPRAHAAVTGAALAAGKHVYVEKPLGISRAEGIALMEAAAGAKRSIGCAPDTFLGSALQTARRAIDDGRIGRPVAFSASMMCPGHERWHPNPEFYYQLGGGPMFDMGPYYLTALLNLFGPVRRLSGLATTAIPERTITSAAKFGQTIRVQTPDHIIGLMEFENGAAGTIVQSFATHHGQSGGIAVYGTEGALLIADPNQFSGAVRMRLKDQADWAEIEPAFGHDYGRSVGLADMADAITNNRPIRASGQQAMAVLDLMQGFLDSSAEGRHFSPTVAYERPAALPTGGGFGVFHD